MTWISKSITTFGLVILAHACYSAHEHSALYSSVASTGTAGATMPSTSSSSPSSPPPPTTTTATLPIDISIETVTALVVVCLGLVLGSPQLRPIQWREWAGKVEREGEQGFLASGGEVEKDFVGNPFRYLESRPGFIDIRRQRREFTQWVKTGGIGGEN